MIDSEKFYRPLFFSPQISGGEGASDALLQQLANPQDSTQQQTTQVHTHRVVLNNAGGAATAAADLADPGSVAELGVLLSIWQTGFG